MSEFFANLDRYRQGGKGGGDRGAFLRLYNGGGFNIDRIGRGNFYIPNWSCCFLGGIQPGPIRQIAKSSVEDGLLQRFLYVVPGPPNPGQDRKPSIEARRRYDALFPALAAMHPPASNDSEHPQPIVFHDHAHRHREAIDKRARIEGLLPDRSPQLLSALAKWPGQFGRLALTFHLIDIADVRARSEQAGFPVVMVISEDTAARVARFMLEIVLPHLLRAHRAMFDTSQQTSHAEWIAGYILAEGLDRITTGDVVHSYRALRSPENRAELISVMDALVLYGWLEPQAPTNAVKPVAAWLVNPKVHDLFAKQGANERARRETARAELAAHFKARQQT